MARIWPVIGALGRAVMREQRRLDGIRANNIFWILFLLGQGQGGGFIFLLVALVALFPLCADPFRRLPADRVATWPISAQGLRLIRFASVFLSPAAWIAIGVMAWTRRPQLLLAAFFLIAFAVPFPHSLAFRAVPGWFGELVRKNIRELLNLLDPYIALLLSAATVTFRILRPNLDPDALVVMSLMIVVSLSTCAQSLFSLDGGESMERYRLMPLRGWRILAAKHLALLLIALPLTLPLQPVAALTGLLVAMGIGNHMAVRSQVKQARWSLSAGSLVPGLLQSVALVAAGTQAAQGQWWVLPLAAAGYAASTAFYGWRFDKA